MCICAYVVLLTCACAFLSGKKRCHSSSKTVPNPSCLPGKACLPFDDCTDPLTDTQVKKRAVISNLNLSPPAIGFD